MPPDNQTAAVMRKLGSENESLKQAVSQLQGWMKAMSNVPKWIEDIPGRRSPYFAVIEVPFVANSTAQQSGTTTISTDGPFVCTGVALFHQKTSGAYAGPWGPATAFGAEIALIGQNQGYAGLFNQPHCNSFTVRLSSHGSDRLWQDKDVASALYSPQAGGAYILPASHLFGRNSTIQIALTPDLAVSYSTKVQAIFLGYKIVQGDLMQP